MQRIDRNDAVPWTTRTMYNVLLSTTAIVHREGRNKVKVCFALCVCEDVKTSSCACY